MTRLAWFGPRRRDGIEASYRIFDAWWGAFRGGLPLFLTERSRRPISRTRPVAARNAKFRGVTGLMPESSNCSTSPRGLRTVMAGSFNSAGNISYQAS